MLTETVEKNFEQNGGHPTMLFHACAKIVQELSNENSLQ